jgi:tetratricopeptide (TPR) repeat protein
MHTWLIFMRQIAEENPYNERILNIIAFLDNKGLSFELLKIAASLDFDEDQVLLAASRLVEYSFLQAQRAVDMGLPAYEQHRLVHMATRQALTRIQTFSFSGEALRIMADLFPDGTYETRASCELYLPHALKAAACVNAKAYSNQAPSLLRRIGYYYWEQGRPNEAEQLDVQVLELYKEVLGEKHIDTIWAMGNLASTWHKQGRLDEAEQLEVQVLELYKEVLGKKHLNTILAMGDLACTWYKQGRLDEAEQLEVQVVKIRKEVLGEKHPYTILAIENLEAIRRKQGSS